MLPGEHPKSSIQHQIPNSYFLLPTSHFQLPTSKIPFHLSSIFINLNIMLLLTIAHRGEAQEFIKRTFTQPVDYYFKGVYRDGNDLLLLTEEGIESSILRVSSVLTYFGNKIDRVLNMGIAGALVPALQINQIYGIHQVLRDRREGINYRSLSCKETHSKTDCITVDRGVFEIEYVQFLRQKAQICDRELWGIGLTCDQYQIPFKSYKLISDYAGVDTDMKEIKSKASEYSKHLFDFYKNLSLTKDTW